MEHLVELCAGPEGPLKEPVEPKPGDDGARSGTKAKKKAKKAGKLEDGQVEAQGHATGCLRLMSLSNAVKADIVAAGGIRYLTPLLESKQHHARWNARQALLNLAMLPELVEVMQRYGKKVPNYIHGSNLPPTHLRPITAPPALGAHIASLGLGLTSLPLTKRAIATAPAGQAGMQGLG
eukprot:jgi/Astpho2/3945/e_gw1.00063.187.1_t